MRRCQTILCQTGQKHHMARRIVKIERETYRICEPCMEEHLRTARDKKKKIDHIHQINILGGPIRAQTMKS